MPVGVVVHGPDTKILHANKKALTVLRLTADQALGKEAIDFQWQIIDTYGLPLSIEQFPVTVVLASGEPIEGQQLGVRDSSSFAVTWLTVNAMPEKNEQGTIERVIVTFTENTYERPDIPFKEVVDSAQDIVLITEADSLDEPGPKIVYVNQAFTKLTGYTMQEILGKTPRILQRDDINPEALARLKTGLKNKQSVRELVYNYAKNGSGYWLDMKIVPLKNVKGEVAYFAAIEQDVTIEKNLENELRHFAFHDALTHLPNRRLFLDRLQHSLALSNRSHQHLAVLFIDLNKFKLINDTYGHDVGDLLLIEVAKRLCSEVRVSDVVARIGGDEFVVLLDLLGEDFALAQENVQTIVVKIQRALNDSYHLGDICCKSSVSIGVKLIDCKNVHNAEQILKQADEAMYVVKKHR